MRIPLLHLGTLLFASATLALAKATDDPQWPQSVTLSYEILGTPGSKPLASVSYDPKSLKYSLVSWTPPPPPVDESPSASDARSTSAKLLRVLTPGGSSTLTSLDTFNADIHQKIDLWIAPDDGSVVSASVSSRSPPPLSPEEERYRKKVQRAKAKGKPIPARPPVPNSKKAREEAERQAALYEPVKVHLLVASPGPTPSLATRPPPQVDAEGREVAPAAPDERNFLQKYWWVFLIGMMLMMSGGGQDK